MWPPSGSRFKTSCATSAREANPFRMSVWPVASHTFTPTGTGINSNTIRYGTIGPFGNPSESGIHEPGISHQEAMPFHV